MDVTALLNLKMSPPIMECTTQYVEEQSCRIRTLKSGQQEIFFQPSLKLQNKYSCSCSSTLFNSFVVVVPQGASFFTIEQGKRKKMKMQNESSTAWCFTLFNSFAQPHQNPIKEPIHFDWQVQFFSSKLFFFSYVTKFLLVC